MSTPAGIPTTVVRSQRPQNLPHSDQREESGEEEDLYAKSYNDEEDYETDKYTIILEEAYPTNHWYIMVSIQALASMDSLLQIASGRRLAGCQRRRGRPSQSQDIARRQALSAAYCMRPPPEMVQRDKK